MYICPTVTDKTASGQPDWIKFEYVGVPPGKNARFQVLREIGGNLRSIYDGGWPQKDRGGRKIDKVHLRIAVSRAGLEVVENGRRLFSTKSPGLNFTKGYAYFEMSSHSNYPSRSIFFDNISFRNAR